MTSIHCFYAKLYQLPISDISTSLAGSREPRCIDRLTLLAACGHISTSGSRLFFAINGKLSDEINNFAIFFHY